MPAPTRRTKTPAGKNVHPRAFFPETADAAPETEDSGGSANGSGGADVSRVCAVKRAPQTLQNFVPSASGDRQRGQAAATALPQTLQNFAPSGSEDWQYAQDMMTG